MTQIKQFNDWLVESKQEKSAKFIADMEKALKKKGLSYRNESSNVQLKNGTLAIKLVDNIELLTTTLKERGIANTDFDTDIDRIKYYNCHIQYTIYSRGGVRVYMGASDSLKFDPSESLDKVADWLEQHYKIAALNSIKTDLKPEKFIKSRKLKPYPEEEIAKVLSKEAMKDYNTVKQFPESTPEIVFAIFLARAFGTKATKYLEANPYVNRKLEHTSIGAYLQLKMDDVTISLNMWPEWKIGTKAPTVEVKLKTSWSSNSKSGEKNTYNSSIKEMVELDVIPRRFLDIYDKIKKGDYDLDSFLEKTKHTITAKKFGI